MRELAGDSGSDWYRNAYLHSDVPDPRPQTPDPKSLLHQQHLAGALDAAVEAALVRGGQAGVLAGQDASVVGHELAEQGRVPIIEGVDGEIDLGLGPGRALFHRPIAAVLPAVPLTVVSPVAADWIATVLVLACLVAALWLLDVRDWRIYGVTLLWPAVIDAYQTANVTLPLMLLVALMWRYRDRRAIAGI